MKILGWVCKLWRSFADIGCLIIGKLIYQIKFQINANFEKKMFHPPPPVPGWSLRSRISCRSRSQWKHGWTTSYLVKNNFPSSLKLFVLHSSENRLNADGTQLPGLQHKKDNSVLWREQWLRLSVRRPFRVRNAFSISEVKLKFQWNSRDETKVRRHNYVPVPFRRCFGDEQSNPSRKHWLR